MSHATSLLYCSHINPAVHTPFAYSTPADCSSLQNSGRRFSAAAHQVWNGLSKQITNCETLSTLRTHTHTRPFNGPLSGTTRVSRYHNGKTNLDFTEARDSEWQWHQLGCVQVCTSLQTDNPASTPPLNFFTGRMPSLPPNQQCQSTEGT